MKYLIYFSFAILTFTFTFESLSQTTEIAQSVAMPTVDIDHVVDDFDISRISKFSGFWNNLNNGSINNFEFNNFKVDGSTFTADVRILAAGRGRSHCNIAGHVTGDIAENTIHIYFGEKYQRCSKNYSITLNLESKDGAFEFETLNFFSKKMIGQYRIVDIN